MDIGKMEMITNKRMRKLIRESNLSMPEIARRVGVSTTLIQRFNTGSSHPSAKTIRGLCECFDVSADYLLGLTDEPESERLIGKWLQMSQSYNKYLLKMQQASAKKNAGIE